MEFLRKRLLLVVIALVIWSSCAFSQVDWNETEELEYGYEVVASFPHDREAFTQGLVFHQGFLYEGTGLYGESSLREVVLADGSVRRTADLPANLFGEGIAVLEDKIVQLTWKARRGLVYDLNSFEVIEEFHYSSEGWGLTTDGKHLIMSDGSNTLTFLDAESYQVVKKVRVQSKQGPVRHLNELEYINGEIYANVWLTDTIVRIEPESGRVTGWIDLSGLLDAEHYAAGPIDVLNGIAYDHSTDRLFVTGKLWPQVFQIRLVPAEN